MFLLGDFAAFSRFCALAQANDLILQSLKRDEPDTTADKSDDNTSHGNETEETKE